MEDTQSLKQYTDAKKNVCNRIGQNVRGNADATSFQAVEETMYLAKMQQKIQITTCNETDISTCYSSNKEHGAHNHDLMSNHKSKKLLFHLP